MRLTLQRIKLDVTQIGYVNAHRADTSMGATTDTVALDSTVWNGRTQGPGKLPQNRARLSDGAGGRDRACGDRARHDNRVRALLYDSFAFGGVSACRISGKYPHAR
ncbi:MAG TPA: hypothetical protein VMH32_05490 [Burkholderiales bacterium]|nr:hypothetical protein [Burkholderiales bacterium]